jgi:2-polyprenyl-6-methoxyphenol hydroxylase-like FAD-dependent oxidoreductase
MTKIGGHAIVIGASMGGLLAARALSDFYDSVTVLERDHFPVADIPRKGVPQGRHAHGLLARGGEVIEDFFPGWTDEVVAAGGGRGDIVGDVGWVGHGVTLKSVPSKMIGLLASRPVLEGHVRRRLLALPNVRAIEDCVGLGLVAAEDNSAIRGVRIKVGNGEAHSMLADLVVDASGRGSSSPAWLESLGYARPAEERVEIGIGYTTRVYRRRPDDLGGKTAIVVAGSGPNWRNGALLYQSEDRWVVSIGGYFGDDAPDDDQMFAAYARSLPTSGIYDIVSRAEPLSEFVRYRFPANLRRRYERLDRFPKNYLVFGDALCSFNPVYGQGMTSAALQAIALRDCLLNGSADSLAMRFFRTTTKKLRPIWLANRFNDFIALPVDGWRSAARRILYRGQDKVMAAAANDIVLTELFVRTIHLVDSPIRLMHPAMLMRVISGQRRRSRASAPA